VSLHTHAPSTCTYDCTHTFSNMLSIDT
jgi:hypothetical protein